MNADLSARSKSLSNLLDQELRTPVSAAAIAMSDALRSRYGDAVLSILYYGSCFRTGTENEGIMDIFVIVDDYHNVYTNRALAFANWLLPPNISYFEFEFEGTTIRSKYGLISLEQFVQRASPRCFHTFFWARFAQPCTLTFVRDEAVRRRIVDTLACAIGTFTMRVLPLLPSHFDAEMLWTLGLSASYQTELRPERPGAAAQLVKQNLARYQAVTQMTAALRPEFEAAEPASGPLQYSASISKLRRWSARQCWRIRRVQGKIINLARIMKASFTFDGGVDYVLWKIERHSGIKVEATPMLRRHPLLTCWPTVWRLYRAGAFR